MERFSFSSPVEVIVSNDFVSDLKKEIQKFKPSKIGVVCGNTAIYKTGFIDDLKYIDIDYVIFDEIEENPSINTVLKGGKFLRKEKCDLIIAFGGGSALDAAKAISAFATNNYTFYELLNMENLPNIPLPIIAIPTTSGTGSEVNHYAIITDVEKKDKINFGKKECFPKTAILNYKFLKYLDEKTLFATVFDAFTHAFEGYLSKKANTFSDILAIESIKIILNSLKQGLQKDEVLKNLLFASSLAGIVILHTATTLLHAMGYYLTNHKKIHHGLANFYLFEVYVNLLKRKKVEKYEKLKSIFPEINEVLTEYKNRFYVNPKEILNDKEVQLLSSYALGKPNASNSLFEIKNSEELQSVFE